MKKFVLPLFIAISFITQSLCTATLSTEARPGSFIEVSKNSIPAVVSIRIKKTGRNKGLANYEQDQYEQLWRQFFGLPQGRQQQPSLPQVGQASGFLISPDGYILTNSHVVRDADEILVTMNDDREFTGKVIGQDPQTDLAVIKIKGENFPFLKLGDSDDLQVGQWVIAVGTPLGLQATVTAGIVSAKGRQNLDLLNVEDFIQTDAAINQGNSGGPLISLDGDVIGINTAIVSLGTGGYMGIGFAIPSNIAQHVMEQLIATGEVTRGFMGVALQKIDQNLALAFGLENVGGALVAEIAKGSPADKAGLKQGDVIVKINNNKVTNVTSLRNTVTLMKPGSKINLTILRGGKMLTIPIEVGSFPSEKSFAGIQENKYGFEFDEVTPEIARNMGLINEQGVVISKVQAGSPAAIAGIKKGSLILEINRKGVKSVSEANDALNATEKGKPVLLLIKRGDVTQFVSLKVD